MMGLRKMANNVALWRSSNTLVVSDTTTSVPKIVAAAQQLRERERTQVAANLDAGHYELATTFIWHRTMALLKKQLSTLGNQFISDLLQRPEIDEYTDIQSALSDGDAISLARDLGVINATQAMRMIHSQQVISHFASVDSDELDADSGMTPEEAIACLRVCVQGILGHQSISVAHDFAAFRKKLEDDTLNANSPEIVQLQGSPYFFIKTTINVLINLLRTLKGAALEHAGRNAGVIIPLFWPGLKQPEKWQIGQAYAVEFSEGKKESAKALHSVLLSVNGFDYVPENLRSTTFIKVANSVIDAHQAFNNFHNEPAPMRELASLGTSIPGPALATCMTAILCVKLGNGYGVSRAAQVPANQLIDKISKERWIYYLDECLENDRTILSKMTTEPCIERWISLVQKADISVTDVKSKPIRDLIRATCAGDTSRIAAVGRKLLQVAYAAA